VGRLETEVRASNNGMYCLMHAAVKNKKPVEEFVEAVEQCK
jgi:hypothetical protein